jgi:hypothetical protein
MVRRGSVDSTSAGCKAGPRVRFSARDHREVFPTDLTSDEEMHGERPRRMAMDVFYECD